MNVISAPALTTRLRVGAFAVGGAVLAVAMVWAAARIFGIELRIDPRNGRPPGVIDLPTAVALTLLVSMLGWGPVCSWIG